MKPLTLIALMLFAAGCAGDAIDAENALSGLVLNEEGRNPVATNVELYTREGKFVADSTSSSQGVYQMNGLGSGYYYLKAGPYRKSVRINGASVADMIIPVPRAPTNFRFVPYPGMLCLLWDDESGLEAGFIIRDAARDRVLEIPANKEGISVELLSYFELEKMGYEFNWGWEMDANELSFWKNAVDGAWSIQAFNEYGQTATQSIVIDAAPYPNASTWGVTEKSQWATPQDQDDATVCQDYYYSQRASGETVYIEARFQNF